MKTHVRAVVAATVFGIMVGVVPLALSAADTVARVVRTAQDQSPGSVGAGVAQPGVAPQATNPRAAAATFMEQVNNARLAISLKQPDSARQDVTQARNTLALIKAARTDRESFNDVPAGRMTYDTNTDYKYHYFPIEIWTEVLKSDGKTNGSNQPLWASTDLVVTDVDVVYLTLDLRGDNVEPYLNKADQALAKGDLKDADTQLAKLINAVATVQSRKPDSTDKARNNLTLARHFIAARNYDGARYALQHADADLNDIQDSENYKIHRQDIIAMRKAVHHLQESVAKKDPTLLDQADATLSKWWDDLTGWVKH